MKADADGGMPLQGFEKGQIAAEVGLFEDMVEIAARLMGVNEQNELELGRHGDGFLSKAND